jgi:hypothetical protein
MCPHLNHKSRAGSFIYPVSAHVWSTHPRDISQRQTTDLDGGGGEGGREDDGGGGTLIMSVMLKLIAAIRLAQADLHKYCAYMHEREALH